MSISLPVHPKEFGATLRLVICPEKFLNKLFQYSRDYFLYLVVRDISKIEFYGASSELVSKNLKEFLLKEGFIKEAELTDELGFGKNLVNYSLSYTKGFIEKVEERRKKFL